MASYWQGNAPGTCDVLPVPVNSICIAPVPCRLPQVVPGDQFKAAAPLPVASSDDAAVDATPPEYQTPPDEVQQPGLKEYRLDRDGADWGANLVSGWWLVAAAAAAGVQAPIAQMQQPGMQGYRLGRDGADWGTNLLSGMQQQQQQQQQQCNTILPSIGRCSSRCPDACCSEAAAWDAGVPAGQRRGRLGSQPSECRSSARGACRSVQQHELNGYQLIIVCCTADNKCLQAAASSHHEAAYRPTIIRPDGNTLVHAVCILRNLYCAAR
jgi:hypothetical protein